MKLSDWLSREGLTLKQFGGRIARSEATVSRIARGLQHPDKATMEAIIRATGSEVTPNDFFEAAETAP